MKAIKNRQAKRVLIGLVTAGLAATCLPMMGTVQLAAAADPVPAYQDKSLPFSVRAADLVSRMTFIEKQQQLRAQTQTNSTTSATSGAAPAIPRLNVPAYDWWNEALHGVARSGGTVNAGGKATDFPTGLGLAATWNRDLVLAAETTVSDEARAFSNYYNANVGAHNKGITYWSPTINMHRDPRWGRAEETYGEDPYLTGEIGAQFTLGLQGGYNSFADSKTAANGSTYLKAVATPKHFLANNAENVRHTGTAKLTSAELREYYTPAFNRLVGKGVGAKSLMTAYNHVTIDDGEALPMSANFPILQDMVKRTWGFEGTITSDCDAIRDSWAPNMYANDLWVPEDVKALGNKGSTYINAVAGSTDQSWDQYSGIAYTLKAGTDLDCMDNDYTANIANSTSLVSSSTAEMISNHTGLTVSRDNGYVTDADIDASLVRAFTIRFQAGEFDNGGRDNAGPEAGSQHSPLYGATPWGEYTMANTVDTPQNRALATKAAGEATVLLKNDNDFLPLAAPAAGKKYVVVGHMAQMAVHGDYSPQTSFEYNLSAARAVKEYVAGNIGVPVDSLTNANYQWISGMEMGTGTSSKWAWKKTALGRSVAGTKPDGTAIAAAPAAVRFLNAADQELGRISPFQLYKSGLLDGWTGSRPFGTAILPTTASLSTQGATGGHFGIDVNIPVGTTKIAVEETLPVANAVFGTPYQNAENNRCYKTQIPGEFEVRVGERFTGQKIGTVNAGKGELCGDSATAAQAAVLNRTEPVSEVTANYIKDHLAGTKQKLYFNYSSDWGFDGFTDAEKAAIASADVVIAYAGTTALQSMCATNPDDPGAGCGTTTSASSDSSEDEDRASLDLPRNQAAMIKAAAALNPKTVAWMSTVSQMNVEPFKNDVKAIVWTTYNGQAQSRNITDVLFGSINPSGHLPFTWYTDMAQLPPTADYQMTPGDGRLGRTYQYFTGDVTYPFGHGLSYSKFEYSNLRLNSNSVDVNGNITATVTVKNTSSRAGQEVVQLYAVSPKAGEALRPDKQLKGFTKVSVPAFGQVDATISLPASDLWFWDTANAKKTFDLGNWRIVVGPNADLTKGLSATLALAGTLTPAVDVVSAIPDGVVLHTETPGNVIHANLSATRKDQSFYDLKDAGVQVQYTSSNPAVARVSADGAVSPVAPGAVLITAKVTANGTTGQTTFPVVVVSGAIDAPSTNPSGKGTTDWVAGNSTFDTTLYRNLVNFPDQTITLAEAKVGIVFDAKLIGEDATNEDLEYEYSIALAEDNSAAGTLKTNRLGTTTYKATKVGKTRVTALALSDTGAPTGTVAVRLPVTATINVVADDKSAAQATVTGAQNALNTAAASDYYDPTTLSALQAAINNANTVIANPDALPSQVAAAVAAVTAAQQGLRSNPAKQVMVLTAANTALANTAGYTAASLATLQAAVNDLNSKIRDSASPSVIEAALKAVEAAQAALVTVAPQPPVPPVEETQKEQSKAILTDTISAVNKISSDGYTAESYAPVAAAVAAANAAIANPSSTATQLSTAINNLINAVAGLKPIPAPVVTPPVEQPGDRPPVNNPNVTTKSVTVKGAAFKKNTAPKISVTVKLSTGVAKGKVTVYVGSKAVKTVNVSKLTTSITLPSKYKKAISVKAQYKPAKAKVNGTQKTSAAVTIKTK